jgi:hypothetical protein
VLKEKEGEIENGRVMETRAWNDQREGANSNISSQVKRKYKEGEELS